MFASAHLLNIWEMGVTSHIHNRPLLLASLSGKSVSECRMLTVGERDYYLFQLREHLFGSRLLQVSHCPNCGEDLEWESDIADFCGLAKNCYPIPEALTLKTAGCDMRYRLPTIEDMEAVVPLSDLAEQNQQLLARCWVDACDADGQVLTFAQLPEQALQAMVQAMEQADPLARLDIDLSCPTCGHQWAALFDIASYLWAEVDVWARRTLHTIHRLARAYGWSESEILAMTPTRRQLYLDMVT